ncbi:MAG: HAD family hydrolase [Spirochaetales bacterium]|nr:HAD family hydrolase [Spirochaetales bacterium]
MIYISDLDGTLLNDKAQLSKYSKVELNKLLENGIQFTVASGRSVVAIKKILDGIKIKLPIVEFNGAFISDFANGKHLVINNIEPIIVQEIDNICKSFQKQFFLSTFNGKEDKLYFENCTNDGMKWYVDDRTNNNDSRIEKVENISEHNHEKVICFTIINKRDQLLLLTEEMSDKYKDKLEIQLFANQYSPGWYWLTLHNVNATKDKAICKILEMYNQNINELVVFGDDRNDIPMFKIAKNAIAVENAIDDIKQIATEVIGSNNDDSVVKYIKTEFERRSCS